MRPVTFYVGLKVTWEAIWLRLLLTKLRLLKPHNQFADIYIHEYNKCAEAILLANSTLYSERIPDQSQVTTSSQNFSIDIKGDNQNSFALAKNPVLYTQTKHIDIQYHYIWDKVTVEIRGHSLMIALLVWLDDLWIYQFTSI